MNLWQRVLLHYTMCKTSAVSKKKYRQSAEFQPYFFTYRDNSAKPNISRNFFPAIRNFWKIRLGGLQLNHKQQGTIQTVMNVRQTDVNNKAKRKQISPSVLNTSKRTHKTTTLSVWNIWTVHSWCDVTNNFHSSSTRGHLTYKTSVTAVYLNIQGGQK